MTEKNYTPAKNQGISMVQCPYFTTAVYDLDEPMTLDYSELDSFVILIGLKGEAKITDNEGNEITLQGGESIVVPANTKTLGLRTTQQLIYNRPTGDVQLHIDCWTVKIILFYKI